MSTETKKLQGKDLINVGIFSAIYLVITMAVSFLNVIPFFNRCFLLLFRLLVVFHLCCI